MCAAWGQGADEGSLSSESVEISAHGEDSKWHMEQMARCRLGSVSGDVYILK